MSWITASIIRQLTRCSEFWITIEMVERIEFTWYTDTNAIIREYQQIAETFVLGSDFIFFITSAERPVSESEHEFMNSIRQWGKKVCSYGCSISSEGSTIKVKIVIENILINHFPTYENIYKHLCIIVSLSICTIFLTYQWKQRVVVAINKYDVLQDEHERKEVYHFVKMTLSSYLYLNQEYFL